MLQRGGHRGGCFATESGHSHSSHRVDADSTLHLDRLLVWIQYGESWFLTKKVRPMIPTPATDGFALPPEWQAHAGCLMAWPTRTELWKDELAGAKADYASIAEAISAYEPVIMVCRPQDVAEVRERCGSEVEPLALPLDDSWMRDTGPIFVRNAAGEIAAVDFEFNAWGRRWHPYEDDARLAERICQHLGVRRYSAPMVLEGGAISVDGAGLLLTTEQCLLKPNRNPHMSRADMEEVLRSYLGIESVLWLATGHSLDVGPAGTDGHIDGVAAFAGPGHVVLEVPSDPNHPETPGARANLERLEAATDLAGAPLQISIVDPGSDPDVSYVNFYLANGAVIVPVGPTPHEPALEAIAAAYPDRKVVPVPGDTVALGGGGPHCITQQIPAGPFAEPTQEQNR